MNRVPTGIKSLDSQINGGFPSSSVVAYLGPVGSGKSKAGLSFLMDGDNNSGLYFTTTHSLSNLQKTCEINNYDFSKITYIDGVNWRLKRLQRSGITTTKYEVDNLTDLNRLLSVIIEVVKENPNIRKLFFDSASSLLMYSTPSNEQVFKFFELLTTFTRSKDVTFVYTLEKQMHKESVISTLLFLSDGGVDFQIDDNGDRSIKASFLQFI